MFILLIIFGFMLVSTIFVIAAGMLSSRLSKQERWIETYEQSESVNPAEAQSFPIK